MLNHRLADWTPLENQNFSESGTVLDDDLLRRVYLCELTLAQFLTVYAQAFAHKEVDGSIGAFWTCGDGPFGTFIELQRPNRDICFWVRCPRVWRRSRGLKPFYSTSNRDQLDP